MGHGIAEVDQESITQMLGNVTFMVLDDVGAGLLIALHHFPQLFWIELCRERGGAHQVTEHHRELTALGLGSARGKGTWRSGHDGLCRLVFQGRSQRLPGERRATRWAEFRGGPYISATA